MAATASSRPSSNTADTSRSSFASSQSTSPSTLQGEGVSSAPGTPAGSSTSRLHVRRTLRPSFPGSRANDGGSALAIAASPWQLSLRLVDLVRRALVVVVSRAFRRGATVARGPLARAKAPDDERRPAARHAGDCAAEDRPGGWDQEQEADHVGDEAGRQQERPAEDHHRAVEDLAGG